MKHHSVTAWTVPAIGDVPILPSTLPGETLDLCVQGCRGQYVPISICLRSPVDCTATLSVSRHRSLTFDVRWVARTWQSNTPWRADEHEPVLMPLMLLHDPTLIVAGDDKTNQVRSPILDTAETQPITLLPNQTQQAYILVKIPADCPSRRYDTCLDIEIQGGCRSELVQLPITVDVLPFELPKSPLTYTVFYHGQLHHTRYTPKTMHEYENDLRNMAAHGVTHPVSYEDSNALYKNWATLRQWLEVWKRSGMSLDKLFLIHSPFTVQSDIAKATEETRTMVRMLKAYGVGDVYLWTSDEPTPERMREMIPILEAKQAAGAKTFACLTGRSVEALEILGKRLDLVMFSRKDVDKTPWQSLGVPVYYYDSAYWAPHYEKQYRRKFGLDALKHGWEGISSYAYSCRFGESWWQDTDHFYPDHTYTYPGAEPIDALRWEAWREGVYDVGFAEKLAQLGGTIPDHDGRPLDEVRAEVIASILEIVEAK